MDSKLQQPEIINPYGLCRDSSEDTTFVKDLSLDTLLRSVPFTSYGAVDFASQVLSGIDSDDRTGRYRQDVFEELVTDSELRGNLERLVIGLEELRIIYEAWRTPAKNLFLLRSYKELMQNLPDLTNVRSKALKEVNNYLNQVRGSDEFSELCEFLERIKEMIGIDFRISLSESHGSELCGLEDTIQKHINKQLADVIQLYRSNSQIANIKQLLGPLDFYVGFAKYFVELREKGFDICRPTLLPKEERRMNVKNARNPLLIEARTTNGYRVVPNDVGYDPTKNIFIITGPNNGGKTTYVKTVGLIQLMAQKGLYVPAESAEVSFVDGIYTHFVAPDDITKGEGRYRNELRRIKEIFERATPYSLVILDEPCGGTSYEEGQRQSLVLLDGLHQLGAATYFTTHMHPLAKEIDSGRYPAGKNLQVECVDDGEKLRYTYRVIPGSSGKSYGKEIAREIGLTPDGLMAMILGKAKKGGYTGLLRKK